MIKFSANNFIPTLKYHKTLPIEVGNSLYIELDDWSPEMKALITFEDDVFEALVRVDYELRCHELTILEIIEVDRKEEFLDLLNGVEDSKFWNQSPSHQKLWELFFQNQPVKAGKHEGQRVKDNVVLLGTKIGPHSHTLTGLVHEMSHLIEIDNKRAVVDGWGFSYGQEVHILGQVFNEPSTYQASLRETRVIAIEAKIYELIGYTYDIMESVRPLVYMGDFFLVPGTNERERLSFLLNEVINNQKSLTESQIKEQWRRKMKLLGKY